MSWVAGVDVGGTFTDIVLAETSSGQRWRHKVPSLPADPSRAILDGLEQLIQRRAAPTTALLRLAHGTTVATNALIERRGGPVALITTAGFRDVLEIGRQTRPKLYDLAADHPAPLVPRQMRFEIRERIGPGGEVIQDLTEAEIARLVATIASTDCVAVAVGLLFAFANPSHEQRIGAALRQRFPERHVSLSCEVQPEFREYERLSTTVLNAFLQPTVGPYVTRLAQSLTARSDGARLDICQSSGGLMSAGRAAAMPVRTAMSGPAAGTIGALAVARRASLADIITFDMGGTSTDVCLVRDGQAALSYDRSVAGFPVRLAALDIHTVGAGGGSIAHIDRDGLLRVGPQSAGADPGPACYGRGGRQATVSDANIVLGRLPESLIGGGMRLERTRAEAVIAELGASLGLAPMATALGIVRIVNANMVRAIRTVSIERGWDPRRFALMPFGGAGPLHAAEVAEEIGIARILVPPSPGILCAEGVAEADLEESFVATARAALTGDLAIVRAALAQLSGDAEAWFAGNAIAPGHRVRQSALDMRYIGQNYELSVPIAEAAALSEVAALRTAFHRAHAARYGHSDETAGIEIVNVRLTVRGRFAALPTEPRARQQVAVSSEPTQHRAVWFENAGARQVACFDRAGLPVGWAVEGPAIVEQFDATTLIPPGWAASVLPCGSLLMERRT